MSLKSLSVFFPAYNEEKNITKTVEEAIEVLKNLKLDWEIVIINDGSKDNTKEVGEKLVEKHRYVKLVNQPNGGYGMALRGGFENTKYDTIVYTDSDGQFKFEEVTKFIEKLEGGADLVLGYRIKRADKFIRLVFGKGWRLALFVFFGLAVRDVDCGFKMVKRSLLNKIPPLESTRGGMINAELAIKAKKYGFKVAQVGVNHYARKAGAPTGANLHVIIQSFIDLLKLRFKLL